MTPSPKVIYTRFAEQMDDLSLDSFQTDWVIEAMETTDAGYQVTIHHPTTAMIDDDVCMRPSKTKTMTFSFSATDTQPLIDSMELAIAAAKDKVYQQLMAKATNAKTD